MGCSSTTDLKQTGPARPEASFCEAADIYHGTAALFLDVFLIFDLPPPFPPPQLIPVFPQNIFIPQAQLQPDGSDARVWVPSHAVLPLA